MQYKITPVKVKIYDTQEANVLDVRINQDNGVTCSVQYGLLYVPVAVPGRPLDRPIVQGSDSYKIIGADYTNYKAAADKMIFASEYVATKLSLTIVP